MFSRTSQFIIGLNKYLDAMNNKLTVGMRFKMRFEGEDSPERFKLAVFEGSKQYFFGDNLSVHIYGLFY